MATTQPMVGVGSHYSIEYIACCPVNVDAGLDNGLVPTIAQTSDQEDTCYIIVAQRGRGFINRILYIVKFGRTWPCLSVYLDHVWEM